MKITVIIAAYQRIDNIKKAIQSIYDQEHPNCEILVCCDGEDENIRLSLESYHDPRIQYHFVPYQGRWGYSSRNAMSKIATGDIVLHLDQDNTFYKNCFFRIIEEWEDNLGLLVFRINHEVGIIPKGEIIKHANIDTMNGAIKKEIAQKCSFNVVSPSGDSVYYKQVEEICNKENYKIKFIKDILGIHN